MWLPLPFPVVGAGDRHRRERGPVEPDLVLLGRPEAAALLRAHVDDRRSGQGQRRPQRLQQRVEVVTRDDADVGDPEVLEELAGLGEAHDRRPQAARPVEQLRPDHRDALDRPVVGALALAPRPGQLDLREVGRERADGRADRHLVVVHDDQQLGLALADVVERLEREAAHQRGVTDDDRDALHAVAQVARLGQPLGDRQSRPGMPAIEDIVRRLTAAREPAHAVQLAERAEPLQAAGQELVRIGLVPRVPDDLVARRLQQPMQRDRELHYPERGAEVAAGLRDGRDDRRADLGRELGELGLVETAQLGRVSEVGQEGHGRRMLRWRRRVTVPRRWTGRPGDGGVQSKPVPVWSQVFWVRPAAASGPTAEGYAATMLTDDALQGLRDRLDDRLVHPDHADYDATRQTFNATIDKRPAAIALPETTEEVAEAVRAARAAGLSIAVRGGGHGVAGHSVADGALVIDLRRMRSVTVDPVAMRARAGGGAVWEDVDRATIAHDLAVTGGTFWDTGIGGLTLGGGLGFLMGSFGLTCDNLMRATLVTADGSIVDASLDGDPELLWALRGGGGNFGVVTEFEYRVRPLGPMWFARYVVHLDEAAAALEAIDRYAADAPDEVVIFIVGPTSETPPGPDGVPAGPADHLGINVVCRATREVAEAAVAPIAALPGLKGGLESATYEQIQGGGELMPFGLRHYWKGYFITSIDRATAEATVDGMRTPPAEPSFVLLEALTGQARHEPEGGAAFGQRAARWNASALAIWADPADDDTQIAWARRVAGGFERASLSGAGYANYASSDETAERVLASFGTERFARLAAVSVATTRTTSSAST